MVSIRSVLKNAWNTTADESFHGAICLSTNPRGIVKSSVFFRVNNDSLNPFADCKTGFPSWKPGSPDQRSLSALTIATGVAFTAAFLVDDGSDATLGAEIPNSIQLCRGIKRRFTFNRRSNFIQVIDEILLNSVGG